MEQPAAEPPSSEASSAYFASRCARIFSWWKSVTFFSNPADICGCTLVSPQALSSRVSFEEGLNKVYRWQAEVFSFFALRNWRVKIVTHALSAMQRPPSLVVVQCRSQEPDGGNQRTQELGGYSPEHNTVWLCGNRFWSPANFRRVLLHELLHAFDFARAKIDTNDCSHIACTEIRAINLSEQCGLWASRNLAPAHIESPLARHLLLKHSGEERRKLHQQAAAARALSDEAVEAAVDAARAVAAVKTGSLAAKDHETGCSGVVAALENAELLAAQATSYAKAAKAADEATAAAASANVLPWQGSKRNACVSRQALLSLQRQPQCRHPGVSEAAVASVFSRCLADTWPFEHPPEFDSRFRPSRIYEERAEAIFSR